MKLSNGLVQPRDRKAVMDKLGLADGGPKLDALSSFVGELAQYLVHMKEASVANMAKCFVYYECNVCEHAHASLDFRSVAVSCQKCNAPCRNGFAKPVQPTVGHCAKGRLRPLHSQHLV